jgi:hypothetical protein
VQVAINGQVQVVFDTAIVTVNDYVGISASSGLATDSGSSPGTNQNIGQIILSPLGLLPSNCNVAPGCYVLLELGSGTGGTSGGNTPMAALPPSPLISAGTSTLPTYASGITYWSPKMNWTPQSPSLSWGAGGSLETVTLTPCPVGVDTPSRVLKAGNSRR